MSKYSWLLGLAGVIMILVSCSNDIVYNPKPRSFPKIEFPDRGYTAFEEDYCEFSFDYPSYANVKKDNYFFDDQLLNECWFDLELVPFNGALHCSYVPLNGRTDFDKMVNDAFTMVGKHNIKAQYRDDFPIAKMDSDVYGMMFELEGEVASKLQFYLSDSTNHFFRAALYFNSKVNPDSIAPVYNFVKEDVLSIIESFEWK